VETLLTEVADDVKPNGLATIQEPPTPMALIATAMAQKYPIEQLTKLFDLQERFEKNQARNAFFAALTAFKQNPPEILKTKTVSFNQTTYKHAPLGDAAMAIAQALGKHGLSHRWETKQFDNGKIEVTCILSHELGHEERTTLAALPDASGGKNAIQAVGSTTCYLERYTLFAATGLSAQDDDDGAGSAPADPELLKQQIGQINEAIDECEAAGASVDFDKFLKWLGIENLDLLTPKLFSKGMYHLTAKRKKAKKNREPGEEG